MINPENQERNQKISIPVQDNAIRKRKRRFIYYGLCILFSFVISRIFLIIFSIAQFDSKNYAFNQINYSTRKPKSIYLEARHCDAFSPLNAQVLEGVISLYCAVPNSSARELMAEIHIPLLEVEKYKCLQFKGDIVWKNVQPKAIYNCRKMKNPISVHFTGNVWFRFCYIKFKKSHSEEFSLSYPFSDSDKSSSDSPIHIKSIKSINYAKKLQITVDLDLVNLSIPTYLNIQTDDVTFNFGGDLPFSLTILNQLIDAGQVRNVFTIRIDIEKANYFMFRGAIWKFINNRDVYWFLTSVNISTDNKNDLGTYPINIKDFFNKSDFVKEKSSEKKKNQPLFYFRDFSSENNQIKGLVDIDFGMMPLISKSTEFGFDRFQKQFILKAEENYLAEIDFEFIGIKEFIRVKYKISILNLAGIIDGLILKKFPVTVCESTQDGLFSGLSLVWDGQTLNFYTERNFMTLYKTAPNFGPNHFLHTFKHHIDAINNEFLVCSEIDFNDDDELDLPITAYFVLPRIQLQLRSDKFMGNLSIPPFELQFLNTGALKGTVRTEFKITLSENIKSLSEITKFSEDIFTLSVLKSAQYTFRISDLLSEYSYESSDKPINDKKEPVLNQSDIAITRSDFICFNPPRLGLRINNVNTNDILKKRGSIVRNIITISKGKYLKLFLSGAEIIRNDHILLLDDAVFEANIVNGNLKLFIHDCHLGVGLFSPQEIRTLFSDKIQFGYTNNVLTNIASTELNNLMGGGGEKPLQIHSNMKLLLDFKSNGFNDNMKTTLNLKIGLNYEIMNSFKFADLNFFPLCLSLYSKSNQKKICNLSISKEYDQEYAYLSVNASITRELWSPEDIATLVVKNNDVVLKKADINKKKLIEIIRSFFYQMHVKEKVENHPKLVISNCTLDARNANFNFDNYLDITDLTVSFENYGFRDLIRYKMTSLLSSFFNIVPNNLILGINADNLDVFALTVQPKKISNATITCASTTIYNIKCNQEFEMLHTIFTPEICKDLELQPVLENLNTAKINEITDDKFKPYKFTEDELVNPIPPELLHHQGRIYPHKLLYGNMNKYALIFKASVRCKLKNKSKLTVFSVQPKFIFVDSIMDLIKDDTITVPITNTQPVFIEKTLSGLSIFLGLNVNIALPDNFEVMGVSQQKIFVKEIVSYIRNEDGHFRMSWKKLYDITKIQGACEAVALGRDFDVHLNLREKTFSISVNHKISIFRMFLGCCLDFSKSYMETGLNYASKGCSYVFENIIKPFFNDSDKVADSNKVSNNDNIVNLNEQVNNSVIGSVIVSN